MGTLSFWTHPKTHPPPFLTSCYTASRVSFQKRICKMVLVALLSENTLSRDRKRRFSKLTERKLDASIRGSFSISSKSNLLGMSYDLDPADASASSLTTPCGVACASDINLNEPSDFPSSVVPLSLPSSFSLHLNYPCFWSSPT